MSRYFSIMFIHFQHLGFIPLIYSCLKFKSLVMKKEEEKMVIPVSHLVSAQAVT